MIRHSIRSRNKIRQEMVDKMARFLADSVNNQTEINVSELTEMRRQLYHAFKIDDMKSYLEYK